MRDVTKEAKLTLLYPVDIDGLYVPAGTFISLPMAAFRTAFQNDPSFLVAMHTKVEGTGKKRGRKPKVKEIN